MSDGSDKPREFMHKHPEGDLQRQDGERFFHVIQKSAYQKLQTEITRLKGIEQDHMDDWKRIQNAERECERLRAQLKIAVDAMTGAMSAFDKYNNAQACNFIYDALAEIEKLK